MSWCHDGFERVSIVQSACFLLLDLGGAQGFIFLTISPMASDCWTLNAPTYHCNPGSLCQGSFRNGKPQRDTTCQVTFMLDFQITKASLKHGNPACGKAWDRAPIRPHFSVMYSSNLGRRSGIWSRRVHGHRRLRITPYVYVSLKIGNHLWNTFGNEYDVQTTWNDSRRNNMLFQKHGIHYVRNTLTIQCIQIYSHWILHVSSHDLPWSSLWYLVWNPRIHSWKRCQSFPPKKKVPCVGKKQQRRGWSINPFCKFQDQTDVNSSFRILRLFRVSRLLRIVKTIWIVRRFGGSFFWDRKPFGGKGRGSTWGRDFAAGFFL